MSTESPRQPPFYCPACGMKHRADLSALQGQSSAVAKVPCARCEVVMALRIGADGLPKCEATVPLGGTMSQPETKKPSLILPLVAASILAAVVSFAVSSALAGPTSEAKEDPRIAVLEQAVKDLRSELDRSKSDAAAAVARVAATSADLEKRIKAAESTVDSFGQTVTGIETRAGKLATTFIELQAETKSLNGRIEANYVKLRSVDKRLGRVEGN